MKYCCDACNTFAYDEVPDEWLIIETHKGGSMLHKKYMLCPDCRKMFHYLVRGTLAIEKPRKEEE